MMVMISFIIPAYNEELVPWRTLLAIEEAARGLEEALKSWNHPAFTVTVHEGVIGRSVRTDRWRYTEWNDGAKATELYDPQDDPLNCRNLAGDAAKAEVIAKLKTELRSIPRFGGVAPDNVQIHPVKK
jgi:arylsulfatase A-like enzyme